ncbi:telomere length regulation protein TEL2 homolog isoform X2 [Macadamia integrifolia]|uniref:telomere length regulation protein TEL2 homolog isoform X2 n=1 Tax=Macadamia integrifolia TaxID=60698 RepID=UPI001C4E3A8A|nr:telomere length regulation protein TEL2 homolog isoform X2 [Macadamia integrifolia]
MEESRRRRELESKILEKVGEVVSAITEAKYVDQVICALHSIAVQLFPIDSSRLSGCVDSRFRNQLLSSGITSSFERDEWWHVFYHGAAFPTLARVLVYNVSLDWLACFPLSARTHVYDSFFVKGPPTEVVQAIIPGILKDGIEKDAGLNVVCSNAERILVLCLLNNNGMLQMAREFGGSCSSEKFTNKLLKPDMLVFISRIAQLVASIPDKARLGAPASLSSDRFFKQVIIQLLAGAEERSVEIFNNGVALDQCVSDGTFLFVGETFSRICRRGFADVLLAEVIPRILGHVRGCLSSDVDFIDHNLFKSKTNFQFWFKMMETIKDSYAVERFSERLLHQLATEHSTDIEAYWTLWILFHQTFSNQASMRSIFVDKFLLWKVFPVCCLRWILQFAVLDCPPSSDSLTKGQKTRGLTDIVQRLLGVWSKRQFVQSAAMEQQTYVTAAVGLSLEQMSKEELETTKDVMPLILQGVSCRLESPVHLVRRMASCIALVFSKVVDPKNPLYLDDICSGETIDWEFGFNRQPKQIPASSDWIEKADDEVKSCVSKLNKGVSSAADGRKNNNVKGRHKKSELKLVDPDEVVDPATLNNEYSSDEDKDEDDDDDDDDNDSENSECLSDSSLQPYDLSDDDADLKKKISQLVDLVGALRKPDDPDSVERALDVAEKLVRASPDELQHVSGDLVRVLVQVRCSDLTVEGEEDSAEGKRQRALVALLVTCPFESAAVVNKLLYSPNVDISQRILMLDIMTDAAQELADATSDRPRHKQGNLISTSEQPWFLPQSEGPPGAGPWKEVSDTGTSLSWSYRYERNLPLKPSQIKIGKSRRWSLRSEKKQENQYEYSKNKFPLYAAAFMLPAMQGFDKKRHGVDLLGRDFIVLGKLIYMLGVCMRCVAMHPEAMALAPALLDMLSSREVSHHVEAYVRRSVLFAALCILVALHPSFVASALVEGNAEISKGLEWIRTWALHVVESDTDTECSTNWIFMCRWH